MSVGRTVESFIPDYPDQISTLLQYIVASRREFAETAARVGEPVPERGRVYAHQLLFSRIMRLYPRQLLLSDPGTGKTISFETYTEYLRKAGTCRRAYILEKGKPALRDALRQLMNNVIPQGDFGRPTKARVGAAARPSGVADRREIANFYTFNTYSKFANEVGRMTDAAVIRQFSGCAFICDEAHNLSASKKGSKRYPAIERVLRLARRTYVVLATGTPMVNHPRELAPLMNLILPPERAFPPGYDFGAENAERDVAERCQNYVSYVRSELNLARTQFVGEEFCIVSGANARSGYRCTMRGVVKEKPAPTVAAATSHPVDERPTAEQRIVIKTAIVGDIQRAAYTTVDVAETRPGSDILSLTELEAFEIEDEISNSVYNRTIQASLFVFPDGSFGGQIPGLAAQTRREGAAVPERSGAGKYVSLVQHAFGGAAQGGAGNMLFEFNPATDAEIQAWPEARGARSLRQWIGGVGRPAGTPVTHNLARLSAKFAAIVDIELEHAKEEGTAFIYSEIKNGGGVVLLGLCMEQFGYARFMPKTGISGRAAAPMVPSAIPKRLRYALMMPDPDITEAAMSETLNVFNSPENADGSIIKVLIGSKVSRESINIHHALRAHELTPPWTRSAEIQAFGRVTRAVSHDMLFARRLARELSSGKPLAEAREAARITVFMYRHATILPQISLQEAVRISDLPRAGGGGLNISPRLIERSMQSIDTYIHRVSAGKDFPVRRIMRGLKRAAIDCIVNYNRNVTAPVASGIAVDYTADCDYARCEYRCIGTIPSERHQGIFGRPDETYEIMFASPEQAARARELTIAAFERSSVHRQSALEGISTEPLFVMREVISATDTHVPYVDSLQRGSYLIRCGGADGTVFLTPALDLAVLAAAFGGRADPSLSEYSRAPIMTVRREFNEAVERAVGARDRARLVNVVRQNLSAGAALVPRDVRMLASVASRSASYSVLVHLFELSFAATLRSTPLKPNIKLVYDALRPEFESHLTVTTIGALRSAAAFSDKADDPFVDLDDDARIVVSTALVDEERNIRGEYSVAARKGEAGSFRAPAAKFLRVFIPSELSVDGQRARWRYALDPGEIYAFEAYQLAASRKAAGRGRSQDDEPESARAAPQVDAPFYGTIQGRNQIFRIIDRGAREKSWGRKCGSIKVPNVVSLIIQLEPDVTPEAIFRALDKQTDPGEPDEMYLTSTLRPVDPAAVAEYLSQMSEQTRAGLSDADGLTAYQIGRMQRKDLCAYLQSQLAERALLIEI